LISLDLRDSAFHLPAGEQKFFIHIISAIRSFLPVIGCHPHKGCSHRESCSHQQRELADEFRIGKQKLSLPFFQFLSKIIIHESVLHDSQPYHQKEDRQTAVGTFLCPDDF